MTILRQIIIGATILALTALVGYIVGYQAHEKELVAGSTDTHVTIIERDSVVYNFITKDSTIIDWHLKPIEHFSIDTVHDTAYIVIPIRGYYFSNGLADVWCSGYDVTLDSLKVHQTETMITETVTVKEPTYRNMIGVEAGLHDASVLYIRSFGRINVGISAGYNYDWQASARCIVGFSF